MDGTGLDALALLAEVADDLVVGTARDTHRAVGDRVDRMLRPVLGSAAVPVEVLHRGIATAVYGGAGLAVRSSGSGLGRIAGSGVGPRLEDRRRGRFVVSAVNGLIGDELRRTESRLALSMTVRAHGRDVALSGPGLAAAYPGATGRLAVFLHGLCEDEGYWDLGGDRRRTYGEALAARGWTPVFLRANTGLPIRENGVTLAGLLRDLVACWPVEVDRVALVGHSMGGLVMRSAAAVLAADATGGGWTDRVSDVITLATPHRGAPIAWGLGHGSRLLGLVPETSAFARILERRSAGIRDLVDGLGDDVPPLPHARYRLVAATVTRSARHPVGSLAGDLLVRPRSAAGRDRHGRELFAGAEVLHVGRTGHFGVLNHPEVHAALERWLA